jgi:hypothetical protein
MKRSDKTDAPAGGAVEAAQVLEAADAGAHPLQPLMRAPLRTSAALPTDTGAASATASQAGVVVGEVLGFVDGVALVSYSGQPGAAALRARTTVDLHGAHVGRKVVMMFESADPARPIVMGLLRGEVSSPEASGAGSVEVDADGERLIVTAKDQLVLRCGASSITLTKAGKVLIQGKYVSSRSSGVNRIKGGSVQIN